ncbi:MAG: YchF/TatD family DNA exonuclease [Gammaproteobacteria bacterium]|nr:YchF/TatD family DNA exonuclease [Gammaproteobacteria bacterium]
MLCVSVNFEDYPQIRKLAQEHSHIFSSVGVHPLHTQCHEPSVEELVELSKDEKVVAIGETGLDYFKGRKQETSKGEPTDDMEWQRQRFRRHIEASRLTGKPLIIHTRAAAKDTMSILEELDAGQSGGVMHCFAETWDVAKRALDIGFYISFSGIVTFKNADTLREVARKVPSDRFLIETDSPYLAPVPNRGKTNEPGFVRYTAKMMAELRGETLVDIASQSTDNFFELFSFAKR